MIKTIINKNERHALMIEGEKTYLIDMVTMEKAEILNYTGELIYWDVFGECFVYDDGTEPEYKYIGKVDKIC